MGHSTRKGTLGVLSSNKGCDSLVFWHVLLGLFFFGEFSIGSSSSSEGISVTGDNETEACDVL